MLFSQPVTGITGMDTPGITNCTVSNGGFYVCNNSVEDMQYPSYSTGNGRDVVWEGAYPPQGRDCSRAQLIPTLFMQFSVSLGGWGSEQADG